MIYVFGHRNPDSDSICTAIVVANWLNTTSRQASAVRLGDINRETAFILESANIVPPPLLNCSLKDQSVWIIDFAEFEQGPDDLKQSDIKGIIDHHRLGSITTKEPVDIWIRPFGSSATVFYDILSQQREYVLSAPFALLLLGAIISDTVNFLSPTTTEKDLKTAASLAKIANVNLNQFAYQLLAVKTDITGLSANELLTKDEKTYQIEDKRIVIGQVEIADFSVISTDFMLKLQQALNNRTVDGNYDFGIFALTSLMDKSTRLLLSTGNPISQDAILLDNVMSRKKQILPWLTDQLLSSYPII